MVKYFVIFALACGSFISAYAENFTPIAKKAIPAVVFIKVEGSAEDASSYPEQFPTPYGAPFGDEFFNRFLGPFGQKQPQPKVGQGSGFLISSDGYIMTNAHVVKGADKIEVTLNDGRTLLATLVGADVPTDIAIAKIEGKDFPFLALGDSDALEIAEEVMAIGSPFQLEASVTVGVVSAKKRQDLHINDHEDFVQTDVVINPGNSGGPLINHKGEVVGINSAIFSRTGGFMGISFSISSNMAKNIKTHLLDKGSVTRAFLGITWQPIDKELAAAFNLDKSEGVLITEVIKDSPAEKAGLKQGDILTEYNNKVIKSGGSFRTEIALMNPGTLMNVKVNRKGEILNLPVTLAQAPGGAATAGAISQKLGIEIDNLTAELSKQLGYIKGEEGVVITKVKPGTPAALSGMRPGFLVLAVNHKKVTNTTEFSEALSEAGKNKRILLLVRQGSMTRFYSIRIE